MSRIKPYKAKRRIADYAALEQARKIAAEIAVAHYRTSLMKFFDRRKATEPIRWERGPGSYHGFDFLRGQMEKAQYAVMVEDDSSPRSIERSGYMIEHARRGTPIEIAQYLMKEGFIKESSDHVHGIGHRLTFTIYAAKVTP